MFLDVKNACIMIENISINFDGSISISFLHYTLEHVHEDIKISLARVPGHRNVESNEIANESRCTSNVARATQLERCTKFTNCYGEKTITLL